MMNERRSEVARTINKSNYYFIPLLLSYVIVIAMVIGIIMKVIMESNNDRVIDECL
jgi:hypothetical protein